jgi:hypothetical protein
LSARADCRIHDACLLFYNESGQRVAIADLRQAAESYTLAAGETLTLAGNLQRVALVPGSYSVGLFLRTNQHVGDHLAIKPLEILAAPRGQLMSYAAEHLGTVALDPQFSATVSRTP